MSPQSSARWIPRSGGTPIDAQFCHVWSLKDGKITKFQQYTDTGAFQEIMGVGGD